MIQTVFATYLINVNEYIFSVLYLKALHLTSQNDWQLKWSSKPGIVCWPAIILSPDNANK